jgi:hypothetical protein
MDYAKVLTGGVGAWLQFEQACDRTGLFSEKYLTHPIGQILSARSGNKAFAEFRHPVLAPLARGAGRRPEIDFVVCDPYPKISIAVESKWIGRSKPTIQSVLWDLIRLELLVHHEGARCFFILGGKRSDLGSFFAHEAFSDASGKPHKKPLLRHDNNSLHRTNLVPTDTARVPALKALFAPHLDMEFPHQIITRRSAPFPPDQKPNSFQVYAWEVLSPGRRDTFWPRNSKHYAI